MSNALREFGQVVLHFRLACFILGGSKFPVMLCTMYVFVTLLARYVCM